MSLAVRRGVARVLRRELVSADAVRGSRKEATWRHVPHRVLTRRNWLEMPGVHTRTRAAEMIRLQSNGNRPTQPLEHEAVNGLIAAIGSDDAVIATGKSIYPESTFGIRLGDDLAG